MCRFGNKKVGAFWSKNGGVLVKSGAFW